MSDNRPPLPPPVIPQLPMNLFTSPPSPKARDMSHGKYIDGTGDGGNISSTPQTTRDATKPTVNYPPTSTAPTFLEQTPLRTPIPESCTPATPISQRIVTPWTDRPASPILGKLIKELRHSPESPSKLSAPPLFPEDVIESGSSDGERYVCFVPFRSTVDDSPEQGSASYRRRSENIHFNRAQYVPPRSGPCSVSCGCVPPHLLTM